MLQEGNISPVSKQHEIASEDKGMVDEALQ